MGGQWVQFLAGGLTVGRDLRAGGARLLDHLQRERRDQLRAGRVRDDRRHERGHAGRRRPADAGGAIAGAVLAAVAVGLLLEKLAIEPAREADVVDADHHHDRRVDPAARPGAARLGQGHPSRCRRSPATQPIAILGATIVAAEPVGAGRHRRSSWRRCPGSSAARARARRCSRRRTTGSRRSWSASTSRVVLLASFGLAAALGAIAGVLIAPITFTSYDVGVMLGLKGFAAAMLGGLGSFAGAVAGGLVLGLLESLGAGFVSSAYKDAIAVRDHPRGAVLPAARTPWRTPQRPRLSRAARARAPRWARAAHRGIARRSRGPSRCCRWCCTNNYFYDVAILVALNAIVCVGLNLLIGYAGQISLGHAGFFALGAYGSAILSARYGWPPWLSMPASVAAVGALAFVVGRPILRLQAATTSRWRRSASASSCRSCSTTEDRVDRRPRRHAGAAADALRRARSRASARGTGSPAAACCSPCGSRAISSTRRSGARCAPLHGSEVAARDRSASTAPATSSWCSSSRRCSPRSPAADRALRGIHHAGQGVVPALDRTGDHGRVRRHGVDVRRGRRRRRADDAAAVPDRVQGLRDDGLRRGADR